MRSIALILFALAADAEAVSYFRPTIRGTQAGSHTRPDMAIDGDRMYQT